MNESALIAAARTDSDAFAALYDRTAPEVYRFTFSLTGDHARAEDVTSEVFRRALTRLDRYEDRGKPFVAWLMTIARNLVRDEARRNNGRNTPLLDHDCPIDQWPGDGVAAAEERGALHSAIAQLPAVQQRVIVLRYGREWSVRDVACELGKSDAAVKQLSYRAVNRLRELMQEAGYDGS
ncbi:MAG TPA: sigma-70 family RNA polymerase sigma factor [Tepidiformaceae bacterium]|nr:sigma-70 family RNA polymerase sigma factor [Tepidiformaceae bacterium]